MFVGVCVYSYANLSIFLFFFFFFFFFFFVNSQLLEDTSFKVFSQAFSLVALLRLV